MRTLLKDKLKHIKILSLFEWKSVQIGQYQSGSGWSALPREEFYREETEQNKNFIWMAIS